MKALKIMCIILLVPTLQPVCKAETPGESELTRDVFLVQKKATVLKNMVLSGEESEVFWPLYNEYQGVLQQINDRKVTLIKSYAKDYQDLSQEKANTLLKEFLDIEKDKLKIKIRYVKKFGRSLPPKIVARYFQVENKMEAAVNYDLAQGIPLIK